MILEMQFAGPVLQTTGPQRPAGRHQGDGAERWGYEGLDPVVPGEAPSPFAARVALRR
jgi:hypothetical protein